MNKRSLFNLENFSDIQSIFYYENILITIFSILIIYLSIRVIARTKNIPEFIINNSLLSIFLVILYLLLDAPDVAMTEAAIGACLSTVILLESIKIFNKNNKQFQYNKKFLALVFCLLLTIIMIYIGCELNDFALTSKVHSHVSAYYLNNTYDQIGIKSSVAAILASYRGFDTLGETIVILTAGICVIINFANNKYPYVKK